LRHGYPASEPLNPTVRKKKRGKPDWDLSAQDLALRAMPGVLSLDAEGNARALHLLNDAMDRDPRPCAFGRARRVGAWTARRVSFYVEPGRSAVLAQKALALRADPTVLAIVGNALAMQLAPNSVIRRATHLPFTVARAAYSLVRATADARPDSAIAFTIC